MLPISWRYQGLVLILISLTGCVSPVPLDRALPSYDETVSQLQGQSLLLNIARARNDMPPHFTTTTSIVATFNFETNASMVGNFPSNKAVYPGATLSVGATAAESPTIELVPLRGKDFAQQLLTPLNGTQVAMLDTEEVPLDLLLRLIGKAFYFIDSEGQFHRAVRNSPDIPEEYEEYRRIVSHVGQLDAKYQLYLQRLAYTKTKKVPLPAVPTTSDLLAASVAGFDYKHDEGEPYLESSVAVIGNQTISNFDPMMLDDAERAGLSNKLSLTPSDYLDIRVLPGNSGGDYPLQGAIELRSFVEVLEFVARGIDEAPEYDVPIDPRTAAISGKGTERGLWAKNPTQVLKIVESKESPEAGNLNVNYRGLYYSVEQDEWDLAAFRVLYCLLQMSTQSSPQRAFPITIGK